MREKIDYDSVADLYDAYVSTEIDIPFYLDAISGVRGKILELMSGTGRVSLPLIRAGADLTCVDHSRRMLDVFRSKLEVENLQATIHCTDISNFNLCERFHLILVPFNSFAEILGRERQESAIRGIRDHLTDTGLAIVTLHNPPVRLRTVDARRRSLGHFPLPTGRSLTVEYVNTFNVSQRMVSGRQFYTILDINGREIERREIGIQFHLFNREEFEALFQSAGLKARTLFGTYDGEPFDARRSPFMIWILEKVHDS